MVDILQKIPMLLGELNLLSVIVRVTLSVILGGVLGYERRKVQKNAGIRTHMLVCLGATVVMMTGEFTFEHYPIGDPARLGAQVVSGIGFLGAGTIVVQSRQRIKGLTTAAGLWLAACIGLAVGVGFYIGSILATVLVYAIMAKITPAKPKLLGQKKARSFDVYLNLRRQKALTTVVNTLDDIGVGIENITVQSMNVGGVCTAVVTVRTSADHDMEDILDTIQSVKEVNETQVIDL